MTNSLQKVLARLKALREMRSLGQCVLADTLGINRSTYVRKELGNIPITTEEWMKLAARMNVEPRYFFEVDSEFANTYEDAQDRALLALYHSLKATERHDLLTLIIIAFKGVKRKKVRENIARLSEGHGR